MKPNSYIVSYLLSACILSGITTLSDAQFGEIKLKGGKPCPQFSGMYSSLNPSGILMNKEKEDDLFPRNFPLDKKSCTELVEKRTLKTRTFTSDDGQIAVQNSECNINYFDKENKLQVINAKLKPDINCWAARGQEFPLFLNKDGSTEISCGNASLAFNKNCMINNFPISTNDYTVGQEGMFIRHAAPEIDKKIVFSENRIETDYIIRQAINLNNHDLIFSEELDLPQGYKIVKENNSSAKEMEEYVIYSGSAVKARFRTPMFYDAKKNYIFGKYNLLVGENGKITLQLIVPETWLSDAERAFPVTIDPVVIGPDTMYPPIYMGSCAQPNYNSDSILITIPANITITAFIVTDSYFADEMQPGITMGDGHVYLTSPCGSTPVYTAGMPYADTAGYAYLDSADLKSMLACCFSPSCVTQTFYLGHHLARSPWLGVGCLYNPALPPYNFVYYSPMSPWPFNAFIIGHSVETTQPQWTLIPNTVCSDSCHIKLRVITNYGVPPYTVTHPWFAGSSTYGASVGSCNSTGIDTIPLTIPGCPTYCGTSPTMSVPPPNIVDVCGNTVTGLSNKNITIHNVPDATANTASVCSGSPINIPLSSCIGTTTYTWAGSNGVSGIGTITDNVTNSSGVPTNVTYTVVPTANGCAGIPITVNATINPMPNLVITNPPSVCAPNSVDITTPSTTAGSTAGTIISYWSNGTATSPLSTPSNILSAGTYYIESSIGGCSVIQPVVVSINVTPVLNTNNLTICLPDAADLTAASVTAGSMGGGTLTYWANAGATIPLATPSAVLVNGTYYIVSANGTCTDTASVDVSFIPGANINIINNDTTITFGASVQLNATGGTSYVWSVDPWLSCNNCPNPIASPQYTITYIVTGTDANSCNGTDTVNITVIQNDDILYIPNCITTNHDRQNEMFFAYGVNIKQLNMKIFNRWGELIFESDDIKKGWDGKYRNALVEDGVYVYAVECTWNDGNQATRRGSITVIGKGSIK